jgi:hypothetical protein
MENKDLRKLLSELHNEIENTQEVDEKGLELLRDLKVDITALLDRSEESPAPLGLSNIRNLDKTLSHFEVTHPSLTVLISKLLESLSSSGI